MSNHCDWHHKLPQNQARTNEEMAAYLLTKRSTNNKGCWEWSGQLSKSGYGKIHWHTYGHLRVHRVAAMLWLQFPITDTRIVCHRCDNRKCFNPAHLFVGTHRDNQRDSVQKKRNANVRKICCAHGHEYTAENTWLDKLGHRHCRACHRFIELERYRKRKQQCA